MIRTKKGWIRIVEAFVAVLIVTGFILIVINKGYIGKDVSKQIYDWEYSLLKEISLDDNLREEVLNSKLPVEISDSNFPANTAKKIRENIPNYLECTSKICYLEEVCALASYPKNKNVYAQSISITAINTKYNPAQLKLFCWKK